MTVVEVAEILSECVDLAPDSALPLPGRGDFIDVGGKIGEGGTGVVYRCDALAGRRSAGLILKRHDGADGVAPGRYAEILGAIHRAVTRQAAGISPVKFGHLIAVPFWVGRVEWDNRDRVVSLAVDLTAEGFEPFEDRLEGAVHFKQWLKIPTDTRLAMATDAAAECELLEQIDFVHGDINVANTFVDPVSARCVLIDFDSGWLPGAPGSRPLAWGKRDDFVAPEVRSAGRIHVDRLGRESDRWSVATLLHYLLFGVGPFFFLVDGADSTIEEYLHRFDWPDIAPNSPLIKTQNRTFYQWYLEELSRLPAQVFDAFHAFATRGSLDPGLRPAAADWHSALMGVSTAPEFTNVGVSRVDVVIGDTVTVAWDAPGASAVYVAGDGPLPLQGRTDVIVHGSGPIRLSAVNLFGRTEVETGRIQAYRTRIDPPRIRPVDVPKVRPLAPRSTLGNAPKPATAAFRLPVIRLPRLGRVLPRLGRFRIRVRRGFPKPK